MKRKRIIKATVLCWTVFLIGLALVLFPFLNDVRSEKNIETAVEEYDAAVEAAPPAVIDCQWEQAELVNDWIGEEFVLYLSPEKTAWYEASMNPSGDGMMGYVEIPEVGICLPFYHTATEAVLEKGAGHLEWTSLPTGEPGTHTVIGAHNGYKGKAFFDRLPEMEEGDCFFLFVLDKQLSFIVERIETVEPDMIYPLLPIPGICYCTLFTCAGEGDTHRLLVRGHLCSVEEV